MKNLTSQRYSRTPIFDVVTQSSITNFQIWLFKLSRVNVENDISNDCFGSCKSLRDDKLYIFTGLRFFVGLAVHAGKFRKNYFIHLNIDRLGHESTVLFVL